MQFPWTPATETCLAVAAAAHGLQVRRPQAPEVDFPNRLPFPAWISGSSADSVLASARLARAALPTAPASPTTRKPLPPRPPLEVPDCEAAPRPFAVCLGSWKPPVARPLRSPEDLGVREPVRRRPRGPRVSSCGLQPDPSLPPPPSSALRPSGRLAGEGFALLEVASPSTA